MKIIQQSSSPAFWDDPVEQKRSVATEEEITYLRRLEGLRKSAEARAATRRANTEAEKNTAENPIILARDQKEAPLLPNPSDKLLSQRASGEVFNIDSPLLLLLTLCPEITPHQWQNETLMQLAGYPNIGDRSIRIKPNPENPMMLCIPAANGSGKDQIIIAATAVWFAMKGMYNRCIITSSSHNQVKDQTEPYIKELCLRANKMFGPTFDSIQFYHKCRQTGSEIKLFATDDPNHAEGYHPWPGGEMMLIMNEAKSISEEIFGALSRCTGYSYWIEISSPAGRSGHFYESSRNAVCYPHPLQLNRFYLRHITAYDCPHIPRSHIERMREERTESWFRSSILAEFSDIESKVIIPLALWESCEKLAHNGDDFALGSDFAASAHGDENSTFLRQGSRIIDSLHFRQADTTITAEMLDSKFGLYKDREYTWRADDGGIGRAIIDNLKRMGWNITRTLNQSSAFNKREFLNLGAETYFHVRKLMEKKLLPAPLGDPILKRQLTTRFYDLQGNGKYRLESKDDARPRNKESPDRADAYVLCMYSFRPAYKPDVSPEPARQTIEDFAYDLEWGRLRTASRGAQDGYRGIMHLVNRI